MPGGSLSDSCQVQVAQDMKDCLPESRFITSYVMGPASSLGSIGVPWPFSNGFVSCPIFVAPNDFCMLLHIDC